MRKSGVGVMPEPRGVKYSTSGRVDGWMGESDGNSPAKEYEQSSLMKITRVGSTMARERQRRAKQEAKNS